MYMDVSYLSKWRIRISTYVSSMQSLWYGISVVQMRLSGKNSLGICIPKMSLVKSRLFSGKSGRLFYGQKSWKKFRWFFGRFEDTKRTF